MLMLHIAYTDQHFSVVYDPVYIETITNIKYSKYLPEAI